MIGPQCLPVLSPPRMAWVAALWLWSQVTPVGAVPDRPGEIPALGVLVAQTFLRAVSEGDLRTALPLCAQSVDFDGVLAKGDEAVRARLGKLRKALREGRVLRKIVVMRLAEARSLFGPPPARLTLPAEREVIVGFGRFTRGGLVVFVAQERERFRVVALTD